MARRQLREAATARRLSVRRAAARSAPVARSQENGPPLDAPPADDVREGPDGSTVAEPLDKRFTRLHYETLAAHAAIERRVAMVEARLAATESDGNGAAPPNLRRIRTHG